MKRNGLKALGVVACCGAMAALAMGSVGAMDWDRKDPVQGALTQVKTQLKSNPEAIPSVKGAPVRQKLQGRPGDRPDIVHVSLLCESRNFRRNRCWTGLLYIVNVGVTQISKNPCIKGQTWGHDRSDIWVDKGCRAFFEVDGIDL